jgi:glycosyltransferase involved in cell wall biosynthesis
MDRVVLPSVPTQNLDTVTHSFLATIDLLIHDRADVIHFHGMGNGLFLPLVKLSRKKAVITIDGPDWERPKWGRVARKALRLGARLSVKMADHLIIDNHPSIDYFRREMGAPDDRLTYIPYGADFERPTDTDQLEAFAVVPRGYLLYVGALLPDKGADVLIDGYARTGGKMPLLVVGDSPFAQEFRARVHSAAARDPRVKMLGYVYGDAYRQLVANAYAYVHPARHEGTSPALLQAMAYRSCIVSSDIQEARQVLGDAAVTFRGEDPADLAEKLERVLADPDLVEEMRGKALRRAEEKYSWDEVAEAHLSVYQHVVNEDGAR